MEDYEIKDIFRRSNTPDLHLSILTLNKPFFFTFSEESNISEAIDLQFVVENKSNELAMYSVVNIFFDAEVSILDAANMSSLSNILHENRINNCLSKNLAHPGSMPIFKPLKFAMAERPIKIAFPRT